MKLQPLFDSVRADILKVAESRGLSKEDIKSNLGKPGLGLMYLLLDVVSRNRAYDDTHPSFKDTNARVLPYDGRDYCFYYIDGANDTHLETLLKKVRDSLN